MDMFDRQRGFTAPALPKRQHGQDAGTAAFSLFRFQFTDEVEVQPASSRRLGDRTGLAPRPLLCSAP